VALGELDGLWAWMIGDGPIGGQIVGRLADGLAGGSAGVGPALARGFDPNLATQPGSEACWDDAEKRSKARFGFGRVLILPVFHAAHGVVPSALGGVLLSALGARLWDQPGKSHAMKVSMWSARSAGLHASDGRYG